jgi:hypothetical protein
LSGLCQSDFGSATGSGAWLRQARRVAPALVAADLLRHQNRPMFLCHDIWVTPEAYASACSSLAVRQLLDARKQMVADSFEIGAFTFPSLGETAGNSNDCLTKADSTKPVGWLSTEQLEDELFDAAVQATIDHTNATTSALLTSTPTSQRVAVHSINVRQDDVGRRPTVCLPPLRHQGRSDQVPGLMRNKF